MAKILEKQWFLVDFPLNKCIDASTHGSNQRGQRDRLRDAQQPKHGDLVEVGAATVEGEISGLISG